MLYVSTNTQLEINNAIYQSFTSPLPSSKDKPTIAKISNGVKHPEALKDSFINKEQANRKSVVESEV